MASVAYSVYLSHKLVIHQIVLCAWRSLPLTSVSALALNFTAILVVGSMLYFSVEHPFLVLRRRSAVRSLPRETAVPKPSA